jgi:uracil phosphoribosyltransferase
MKNLTVITHPIVQHNLTRLRDARTAPEDFRRLLSEAAALMLYEATRDLKVKRIPVTTPMARTHGTAIARKVALIPVLRAGLGMMDGMLRLLPAAHVGFIGLKRDEVTLEAKAYHYSLPSPIKDFEVLVVDPMLATGGSTVTALDLLLHHGARHLRVINLLAAPEGIAKVREHHPNIHIYTAAIDRRLNAKGYILPGLGDAGDRLFGT